MGQYMSQTPAVHFVFGGILTILHMKPVTPHSLLHSVFDQDSGQ